MDFENIRDLFEASIEEGGILAANGRAITVDEAIEILKNAPRGYSWKVKARGKDFINYAYQKITKTRTIVILHFEKKF